VVPTPGTWLGAVRDVGRFTADTTAKLERGDLLILYTDGVTEATDAEGRQLGLERILEEVERVRSEPVEVIRDHLFRTIEEFRVKQEDDETLLVARYVGHAE
jgi:sigma-B regulation protein RsbU (phosphoserine phosphatase)